MKQEDIKSTTELDRMYAKELKEIKNTDEFKAFLKKWDCWLDEDTKKLEDWGLIEPLIADCRKENVDYGSKHDLAMALLMPEKIIKVSDVATQARCTWGGAYLVMKQINRSLGGF